MNNFFSFSLFLLLFFGCSNNWPNKIEYDSPKLWSNPIKDYLKVGQEIYPNDFDTRIGALEVFNESLWIGYGDT